MGQLDIGPTSEQESREETLRVAAVEAAWHWIRKHPNWFRHYGFSVPDDGQAEFQASLRHIKARIEARLQQQMASEFTPGRQPAPPDMLDVILTAVYLLRSGRRPVRPLPSGLGATWRALQPFFSALDEEASKPSLTNLARDAEVVSSILEAEAWCVDLAAIQRPTTNH